MKSALDKLQRSVRAMSRERARNERAKRWGPGNLRDAVTEPGERSEPGGSGSGRIARACCQHLSNEARKSIEDHHCVNEHDGSCYVGHDQRSRQKRSTRPAPHRSPTIGSLHPLPCCEDRPIVVAITTRTPSAYTLLMPPAVATILLTFGCDEPWQIERLNGWLGGAWALTHELKCLT